MNRKFIDVIIVIMVIAVICFLAFAYSFMKSNAKECLKDPISYMEEQNEGAECNCWKNGESYKKIEDQEYSSLPFGRE